MNMKKSKTSTLLSIYEWVETFLLALGCIILIFTFAVKFVTVSGESMRDTLQNSDRLLISDLFYKPQAGDVVVVDVSDNLNLEREHGISRSAPYIKRVIATEGQVVDIDSDSWTVFVDGVALDEPYVYHCNNKPMYTDLRVSYPFTVSEGCVFVMGDNRNGSSDSRIIGEIEEKNILGRVILRLFPHFGGVK